MEGAWRFGPVAARAAGRVGEASGLARVIAALVADWYSALDDEAERVIAVAQCGAGPGAVLGFDEASCTVLCADCDEKGLLHGPGASPRQCRLQRGAHSRRRRARLAATP